MDNKNLNAVKEKAEKLLNMDIEENPEIFNFVNHPIFDERVFVRKVGDEVKSFDIVNDKEGLSAAREIMKNNIWSCNDTYTILSIIRKPYRLGLLNDIKKYLDNKEFSELLGDIWTDVENPNADAKISIKTLLDWFKKSEKEYLMQEDELSKYNSLPEIIEIYRGVKSKEGINGLSWTLRQEKAEWFADRFIDITGELGFVVSATAKKEDVLAYFSRRGEDEIIIDPDKLNIHEIN